MAAKSLRLALIQLGNITSNKQANLAHARSKILEAARATPKPDMIVLPECFNSPYGVDYFDQYSETVFEDDNSFDLTKTKSETVKLLSGLAKELSIYLIGGSLPERFGSRLFNTSTVYDRGGKMITFHRKLHLFDVDIPGGITFTESKTLTAGDKITVFDTEFGKLGLAICYDLRFPEMAMIAARRGAKAMIYPGAFNTTTGPPYWELLQRARAVDSQIYVVSCSPARPSDGQGYPAYGFSMVVEPTGKVAVSAEEKETILYATLDWDKVDTFRRNVPMLQQRRFDVYPDVSASS